MNCWEFKKCSREKGGSRVEELGLCPAYPDYGKSCARVVGTLFAGKAQGTFATKYKECKECPFYKSLHYDRTDNGVNVLIIK